MGLPTLLDAVERLGAFARIVNTLPGPGERRTVAGRGGETLGRASRGAIRVLLTTARGVLERTRLPRAVQTSRLELRKGDLRRPEALAAHLEAVGFERVPLVEDVAQFSVRGGVLGIYNF